MEKKEKLNIPRSIVFHLWNKTDCVPIFCRIWFYSGSIGIAPTWNCTHFLKIGFVFFD